MLYYARKSNNGHPYIHVSILTLLHRPFEVISVAHNMLESHKIVTNAQISTNILLPP